MKSSVAGARRFIAASGSISGALPTPFSRPGWTRIGWCLNAASLHGCDGMVPPITITRSPEPQRPGLAW